jgi:hypothetical protein
MEQQPDKKTLLDAYRVPGYRARAWIEGYEHEPPAFVITLDRRSKKQCAAGAEREAGASMTNVGAACAILAAEAGMFTSTLRCAASIARPVA